MVNGRAKSGSPNLSVLHPKYSARNPVLPFAEELLELCKFLGTVGDLETLAKEVWRVADVEVSSPDETNVQLLLLAYFLGQLAILEPSPRRFGESPIWNSARRTEHNLNYSFLLSLASNAPSYQSSMLLPNWVLLQGAYEPMQGMQLRLHHPFIGPKGLHPCEHPIKALKSVNGYP
uniref:Uncharacterized protein n=1 Tax=Solanum tuberosum TaxID=4113 RepID=M1DAY8_SOLTU